MDIPDNVIRQKLRNVYFIWGRGKTTIANELRRKYKCFIYRTDESRPRHRANAAPSYQPHMCRDYEKEYGVSDFWELPAEVIRERERHWLREFTPMVIVDLMLLAATHGVILCEGDIDYEAVIPLASHMVHLSNRGTKFDWFNRPGHSTLDSIQTRTDLSDEEKAAIVRNAYNAVGQNGAPLPDWVVRHNITDIAWDDNTAIDETASEAARYFALTARKRWRRKGKEQSP
ncbi:MAG: hypothetical protein LBB75_00270 [Oscillospiraceae bacterium]|jgi:hypothetical protein|nr:hypothetical protein [Oscillospiraceae bacterium]